MRTGIGILLVAGAAYAFSFAIDLLLGALTGVYPSTAYLPVVTWSVIATVALAVSYKVAWQSLVGSTVRRLWSTRSLRRARRPSST